VNQSNDPEQGTKARIQSREQEQGSRAVNQIREQQQGSRAGIQGGGSFGFKLSSLHCLNIFPTRHTLIVS